MAQPKGYVNPDFPNYVCRLKKALCAWYEALKSHLTISGFVKSKSDASLFIFTSETVTMYILVYFDSILITRNYPALVTHVINSLVPNGIVLSQSKYILEILIDVDMTNCKGVMTPMCSSSPPKAGDGSPHADATLYSTKRVLRYLQASSTYADADKPGDPMTESSLFHYRFSFTFLKMFTTFF
uniref:Reverse transcriptase Ty1/copia-type domain-containing protein n=1 Tax=Solanum lycopersicum TaxID=4081 RepID=A0A3Q7JBY1_SOLLC